MWLAFHIFYHSDRDRLLRESLFPVVADLYAAAAIRRFFFVRYELGGSHIRLRLDCKKGCVPEVRSTVQHRVCSYIQNVPSSGRISEQQIRSANAILVATDLYECDLNVYPDNVVRECEFTPEVARYGGSERFHAALEMFNYTSLEACCAICRPRRTLMASLRQLFRLSVVLAQDCDELGAIWDSRELQGEACTEHTQRIEQVVALLVLEELRLRCVERPMVDYGLSRVWLDLGRHHRRRMMSSSSSARIEINRLHVHMFANRLGISNAIERGFRQVVSAALRNPLIYDTFCPLGWKCSDVRALCQCLWERATDEILQSVTAQ